MALSSLSVASSAITTRYSSNVGVPFTFPNSLTGFTVSANIFTYSSGTGVNSYMNGNYSIRAQCFNPSFPPFRMFDNNTTTQYLSGTNGAANIQLDGTTAGAYNRNAYTISVSPAPFVGGNTNGSVTWSSVYNTSSIVTGEFWQVQFPFQFMLTRIFMIGESGGTFTRSPRSLFILGSADGTNWTLVTIVNNTTMNAGSPTEFSFTFTNTSMYRFYRFVANTLIGGNTWDGACSLVSFRMEGTAF